MAESVVDNKEMDQHTRAMRIGEIDVDDLLRRVKPYLETAKLAGQKYAAFPAEFKKEREQLLAVIWFNESNVKLILGLQ